MKASFDGARRNLATAYNCVAAQVRDDIVLSQEDLVEPMNDLAAAIGGLLCMYDPNEETDSTDLSDDIQLILFE